MTKQAATRTENLTRGQIIILLLIGLAFVAYLGRDLWWPTQDPLQSLQPNVGKNACNKLNGAYRGRIISVARDPVNGTDTVVYRVQRPGSRATYAPVNNTTVTAGKCLDGQP